MEKIDPRKICIPLLVKDIEFYLRKIDQNLDSMKESANVIKNRMEYYSMDNDIIRLNIIQAQVDSLTCWRDIQAKKLNELKLSLMN
jgi:hypothetical protein